VERAWMRQLKRHVNTGPIKGYGSLGNGENCAAYAAAHVPLIRRWQRSRGKGKGNKGGRVRGRARREPVRERPAEHVIFSRHWAPSAYKSPTPHRAAVDAYPSFLFSPPFAGASLRESLAKLYGSFLRYIGGHGRVKRCPPFLSSPLPPFS